MDSKEIKINFNRHSNNVIRFLDSFEKVTYISTLLVEDHKIAAHQSNGFAGWDKSFYYDGMYKESLLIKLGLELTKICEGETSTVIWDDVLKNHPENKIEKERKSRNIYHGVSFIYGITNNISMAINVCTGKETSKEDFEDFLLPYRSVLLNRFKDLKCL